MKHKKELVSKNADCNNKHKGYEHIPYWFPILDLRFPIKNIKNLISCSTFLLVLLLTKSKSFWAVTCPSVGLICQVKSLRKIGLWMSSIVASLGWVTMILGTELKLSYTFIKNHSKFKFCTPTKMSLVSWVNFNLAKKTALCLDPSVLTGKWVLAAL